MFYNKVHFLLMKVCMKFLPTFSEKNSHRLLSPASGEKCPSQHKLGKKNLRQFGAG